MQAFCGGNFGLFSDGKISMGENNKLNNVDLEIDLKLKGPCKFHFQNTSTYSI